MLESRKVTLGLELTNGSNMTGIIIDITADQFKMMDVPPIIVSRNSGFHRRFTVSRIVLAGTFGFEHHPDWMYSLYKAIMDKLAH